MAAIGVNSYIQIEFLILKFYSYFQNQFNPNFKLLDTNLYFMLQNILTYKYKGRYYNFKKLLAE